MCIVFSKGADIRLLMWGSEVAMKGVDVHAGTLEKMSAEMLYNILYSVVTLIFIIRSCLYVVINIHFIRSEISKYGHLSILAITNEEFYAHKYIYTRMYSMYYIMQKLLIQGLAPGKKRLIYFKCFYAIHNFAHIHRYAAV